jgi:hypothetical protein
MPERLPPPCVAHYVDSYLEGPRPGTVVHRFTILLTEADTGVPYAVHPTMEHVVPITPWPVDYGAEGEADDET